MAIYKNSRYANTPTYYPFGDGKKVFDIRLRPPTNKRDVVYHTWTDADTLDFLAYQKYGTSELWWVIMDANPQYQCEMDIKAGDIIIIPSANEAIKQAQIERRDISYGR